MPVRHRRSNRRRAQSRVVNQPPTARPVTRLALPTSPPHRRTPKLLATRPSFVTRYRPPASTHCTHPSPINRRNNRLKFFPLAPNGSPPSPSISSTSPHCSSVSRGTGTNGPTGNNRIRAGLIPHPSASHGAAQHAAPQSAHLPSSADHADASQPQSPEFSLQPHFSLQEFPLQPEFPLQAARTDEPAQPNPSSFHTVRTSPTFLNSPKKIRPLCCAQGPEPGTTFLLPVPLHVSADARRRDQLSKERVFVRQLPSTISST